MSLGSLLEGDPPTPECEMSICLILQKTIRNINSPETMFPDGSHLSLLPPLCCGSPASASSAPPLAPPAASAEAAAPPSRREEVINL